MSILESHVEECRESPSAAQLRPQDSLLSGMPLHLRETFYPLGYPVEVLTNDRAVLDAAHESFGHSRLLRESPILQVPIGVVDHMSASCPPEPERRQFQHLFTLVADPNNQAVLDFTTLANFTWLTQAAAHNRIYFRHNFLEKVVYLLLGASVVTDLHAACVSSNGKGILLFGNSGAGKTTLAYACARAGWTYTSDDTSYLINDARPPRVVGHAHRARFRPSARELFAELEGCALTPRLEGKPSIEVRTADLPVPRTAAEVNVNFIVYLRRNAHGTARLLPLPPGTATQRAIADLYSAGEIRKRHEKILAILSQVPAFELEYCGLPDAIAELDRLTRA